jgi:hypothetical protein
MSNENVVLPNNLEKIQTANTPLDKIKKNLKTNLFSNLNSIVVRICTTCGFPVVDYSLLFCLQHVCCSFNILFDTIVLFYKRLSKTTLNTKDSLYETYFDVRLNMEL